MNKYLFLIAGIFVAQKAYGFTDGIGSELEQSLKMPINEPNIMSIVFALLFVVFLIYITGIIYSKLNTIGAKTLKDQLKNAELNRAVVLSTTQLGQGKNLHVIELNDRYYLIGATQNSINLIKDLGKMKEEEEEETSKDSQKPPEEEIDKAIQFLYGGNKEKIIDPEKRIVKDDEFDIHKKYL